MQSFDVAQSLEHPVALKQYVSGQTAKMDRMMRASSQLAYALEHPFSHYKPQKGIIH